jgi:uncharacterized lipoprotein YddW (UPF0748 family)
VWLFAVTILMFISANAAFDQASASHRQSLENHRQTAEIQRQAAAIQESRRRTIREACEQQNVHNRAAYQFLSSLPSTSNEPKRTPKQRQRLIQKFTDKLVGPVQNCEKRVQQITR